jgi:hypothetical protein
MPDKDTNERPEVLVSVGLLSGVLVVWLIAGHTADRNQFLIALAPSLMCVVCVSRGLFLMMNR